MNKKELRGLMKKYNTITKARKEVQQILKHNDELTSVDVRCYSVAEWGTYSTDLQIEMEENTVHVATIEIEEDGKDFWEFIELTTDIFKTMKKNLIEELEKYNIEVENTEDYNC